MFAHNLNRCCDTNRQTASNLIAGGGAFSLQCISTVSRAVTDHAKLGKLRPALLMCAADDLSMEIVDTRILVGQWQQFSPAICSTVAQGFCSEGFWVAVQSHNNM
jgi:hypothetical protein